MRQRRPPRPPRALAWALGATPSAAARRPAWTIVTLLAVTLLLGSGLGNIQFDENLLQILPRGQEDTDANLRLPDHFPEHYTLVVVSLRIDPEKWDEWNARLPHRVPPEQVQEGRYIGRTNATDEVYLRGLESFLEFLQERAPPDVNVVNVAWQTHVKLLNYTNSYNPATKEFDPATYRLPGTDPVGEQQFAAAWRTVYLSAPEEVAITASVTWDTTRSVYIFTPKDPQQPVDREAIGQFMMRAFEEYKATSAAGKLEWDVFALDKSGLTDAKVVHDAHQNELAEKEIRMLGPLILAFVIGALLLAFRSIRSVSISAAFLGLGLTWSFGFMAHLGIPLNAINLTVVPLIFGVGIDYSIHFINAFLAAKKRGLLDEEAFRHAGSHSGFAMFIATLTTIVGLVVMTFSPSLLISQLGMVAAFALAALYVLALTFIPAAFSLMGTGNAASRYRPSRAMPAAARFVHRHRVVVVVVLMVASGALFLNSRTVDYETFGHPALNFPEDDPIRQSYEVGQRSFYSGDTAGYDTNFIILQGDLTRPEVHRYLKLLAQRLRDDPGIRDDSGASIVEVIQQWQSLKQGTGAALLNIMQERAQPDSTYPATSEEMRRTLDEIFACPCMSAYAATLINRDYDIGVVFLDTDAAGGYAGAERVVDDVRKAIQDLEGERPDGLQVNVGGYTVYSYLFIKYQMPWVLYMSATTSALVILLVLALTRDWRAAALVGTLSVLTSVWWLGVLPTMGIGLSVMLTIPLIFIYCIGSDYGLHLIWHMRERDDLDEAFGVTGKAVFFSSLTDFGAFILFAPMSNLMLRKSVIATSVAILIMLVITMLVVPLFHRQDPHAPAVVAPAAEDPAQGPSPT